MKSVFIVLLVFSAIASSQQQPIYQHYHPMLQLRGDLPVNTYLHPWADYYQLGDPKSLYDYLIIKSILRYYQQIGNKQPNKDIEDASITVISSPFDTNDEHEIIEFDGQSRTSEFGRFRTQIMERAKQQINP